MSEQKETYAGRLLVAMPGIGDERFEKAVIYICTHSSEGALGLIINKPMGDLNLAHLSEQAADTNQKNDTLSKVYYGGPIDKMNGRVLHSEDYELSSQTTKLSNGFALTNSLDILDDIVAGKGPKHHLIALGYAGWHGGQLEDEIRQNGWLLCEASLDLVFRIANINKWKQALASIGIDPMLLSPHQGTA